MTRRIALVAATTATEPPELIAARVRHLGARGWDAHLLCRGEPWASDPDIAALGDRRELSTVSENEIGPFDRRLEQLRPDVIHFHAAWAAHKGMRAIERLRAAIVVSLRDDARDLAIPDPERVWSASALILCPSVAVRDRAVEAGWPADRAEVLELPPIGIPDQPPERSPRQDGPLRLLSFGPLIWEHGLEHAVHGVALARDRGTDCRLRIVGLGDHLHAVAFAAHQLDITDHVEIVRPQEAGPLADELADADVLVDPSVAPALAQTPLLTARELGVPFVATKRPDLEADAGILVRRRDPVAIADAIVELTTEPEPEPSGGDADRLLAEHLERLERLYAAAASVASAAT